MLIQKGFEVLYSVINIGSIKSWGEVKIDGKVYPPSVKFRSTNIETKEDPVVGVREIETIVDFQVHTKTLEQAIALTEIVRKFRNENKEILLSGVLPSKQGADEILVVKSVEPLEDFLKRNNISLTSKEKAK